MPVRCTARNPSASLPAGVESAVVPEIGPATDWSHALDEVEVVFHLAGRAHVLRETARNPAAEFERVNAEGTAQLARCARRAGVRRVVYLSTIGVHGETSGAAAFTEASPLRPHNDYTRSKAHGEAALRSEAGERLEFTIIRPPLVYGAGVPGNFRRLLRVVASGMPLPLANVRNLRSLAAVENLVDGLLRCGDAAQAAGETFVVADGEDFSTPDLVRVLATGLGRPARLIPFPQALLRAAARAAGLGAQIVPLCGNLRVDASRLRQRLGWTPRIEAPSALIETARWYARTQVRP